MANNSNKQHGNWNYPTTLWFGAERITELAAACKMLGIHHPLLVTDSGLSQLPMIGESIAHNKAQGIPTGLFSDIKPNPNGINIENGVSHYHQNGHDGIIAFGGGSALDAGKAIALMSGQKQPLWAFEDSADNWRRADSNGIAPIIAVPTTAGTGSEVGRASLIVDEVHHCKKIIFHPKMLPSIVIADPKLTIGLPANITAATGMDALSHNLEAYCALAYHPMADGIALEGMRLIKEWLAIACAEPQNIEARSHMMMASTMGATAFQKGLGAMHALAHPLGAIYDAHHGLLNAILMPYVLLKNRTAIDTRMQHLARYLELDSADFDAVLNYIITLRKHIGIPNDLRSIGIDESRIDEIAAQALQDPSAAGNPTPLTQAQYATLLSDAINGNLRH
ncbi:MAG: iron-containing alcohol dehydrogenase [Thiotrichaceae bacterium]|nr:iron-containing alcohol dehydrogenase [Thiotrichaceae bacterium]PCI13591.1 MAG: alcohol dehydrogenase [Thiotrichales bacterium]